MKNLLHIGIDIGSTTVKIAVLNHAKQCLHACYVRHYTDIRQKVGIYSKTPTKSLATVRSPCYHGSGGIALADYLHIPFLQEVIAGTKAVRTYYPQSDVIIELAVKMPKSPTSPVDNDAPHERQLRRRNGGLHRSDGNPPRHRSQRLE